VAAGLGFATVTVINSLGASVTRSVESGAKNMDLVAESRIDVQRTTNHARRAQLVFAIQKLESGKSDQACSGCHNADSAQAAAADLRASLTALRGRIGSLKSALNTPAARTEAANMERAAEALESSWAAFLKDANGGNYEAAHAILNERLMPAAASTEKAADGLIAEQRRYVQQLDQAAKRQVQDSRWKAGVTVLVSLAVNAFTLLIVFRAIRRLFHISTDLAGSADAVTGAASEIAAAGRNLADGATEQAASLDQTTAASSRVLAAAQRNLGFASEASAVFSEVRDMAREADRSLAAMTEAMQSAQSSSAKVAKIAKVVEEIALQTNLLALNASVEAARAGSAGAGFSVVADEVRTLSLRCTDAARETTSLIDEAMRSAADGQRRLAVVSNSTAAMVARVSNLSEMVDRVHEAGTEQVESMREMSDAIAALQKVTTQVAVNAEQNSQTSAALEVHSVTLGGAVTQLTGLVGSGQSRGASSVTSM
jgi:methyl-accepting chemotaxis protein/methyl-accepting chemotaxis protein-1 (serine sensor receptor)